MAGEFVLPAQETVTMTGEAARRLTGSGSGDGALLYIYILSRGGHFDRAAAAEAIRRTPEQVDGAMEVLRRLGLVTGENAPEPERKLERPQELPRYDMRDIQREIDNGSAFRELVTEVQGVLGYQLSGEGLTTLFGIYDYLRLPPEVILMLVNYCRDESRRRYGEGRRPSMRAIERTAYAWERQGIFSMEAALEHLKRLDALEAGERELAPVLGISGRALSATERKYIGLWTDMGFGAEAVALAYDRTVLKTGRLTWRYMDSILRSWHAKGLHTPAEIETGDAPPAVKRPGPGGRAESRSLAGQSSSVTADELENMRAALRRMRGEES